MFLKFLLQKFAFSEAFEAAVKLQEKIQPRLIRNATGERHYTKLIESLARSLGKIALLPAWRLSYCRPRIRELLPRPKNFLCRAYTKRLVRVTSYVKLRLCQSSAQKSDTGGVKEATNRKKLRCTHGAEV